MDICGSYLSIMEQISDIQEGDVVYVVSDVLELAKAVKQQGDTFDKNSFIDTLIAKVGESGTVLFPTFNWAFCKGIEFDYKNTPSMTGALSKAALKRADFIRTQHPIYSFAVYGKDQDKLAKMDYKNSFGEGTIFDYMYQKKAKALVIGLPSLSGVTFCHHVEKIVGVPYRYEKEFTAYYQARDGKRDLRTYSMYVRDLEMNPTHINGFEPLGNILEELNVSKTFLFSNIPFHVILLQEMFTIEKIDIEMNDSRNMYTYKGQSIK